MNDMMKREEESAARWARIFGKDAANTPAERQAELYRGATNVVCANCGLITCHCTEGSAAGVT